MGAVVLAALLAVFLLPSRTPPPDPAPRAPSARPSAPAPASPPSGPVVGAVLPPPSAPPFPKAEALPAASVPGATRPAPPVRGHELFGSAVRMERDFAISVALVVNAANADAWVDRLCERAERLRAVPALPEPSRGTREAAAFMEPLIDYEKPLDEPPGRLRLPEELRERLRQYGADWPSKITDADLAGLDFRWLAELTRFDRWSLLAASRLRDVPPDFLSEPIPNYVSLLQWSKLRYALALRRGDLLRASSEVLHLADLVRSQGLLIAEFTALALLRLDRHARDAAAAAGLDVGTWVTTPQDRLDEHRRVTTASMYFAYPGVSRDTLRKAAGCMPSPCPALLEGVGIHRAVGPLAATDNGDLLRELAEQRGCDLSSFDRYVRAPELGGDEAHQFASELGTRIPEALSAAVR